MHSDTLKLALNPEHEKEAAHRVHVMFLNGKRIAVATDFVRLHAEPSESSVATPSPTPGLRQILVPEAERRAVQPPELAAVLYAEQLAQKCRETAFVAVGGQALNAHYVADALRHVGTVGACYVKAGLDHSPVTFESAEHPGRWACVMPCSCHAHDVALHCAEGLKTLECVAARMDSGEEPDDEDEDGEILFDILRERDALRAELEKSRSAVAHVLTRIRDVPELYWHMGAMTEAERLLFAAYSAQHGIPVAEVKKRFAPEPVAYNRWCDEREDADRLIAIGREHDELKARAEAAEALKTESDRQCDEWMARAKDAQSRAAKLREALETIDWHVRREMPIGAFANVAREALAATVTGIPVTPFGITDSQRLDWLMKNGDRFMSCADWTHGEVSQWEHPDRPAIDAAMKGGDR